MSSIINQTTKLILEHTHVIKCLTRLLDSNKHGEKNRNIVDHALITLKILSPDVTLPVPWHRVISATGTISSRGPLAGRTTATRALEAEGVEVTDGRRGDFRVNLATWGWFPAPSTIDTGDHGTTAAQDDGRTQ
ncbi:hypothetical protein J3R82DRAFT_7517 [Butyriboletus roseoflavus]|nr:hypothetical protein J3R82DRAFT_7517 [Butyriboletus roseoflavus]